MNKSPLIAMTILLSLSTLAWPAPGNAEPPEAGLGWFNRIASFPVCLQLDPRCDTDVETVAEIVDVTADGRTLVYTDGAQKQLGFVDLTQPSAPVGRGVLQLAGEPTSVAVAGPYALAAVNTSASRADPSGQLDVVDIAARRIVRSLDLGGQPDSVAVSPDGRYAVIAIENERDEAIRDGALPQLPGGYVTIVDLEGAPSAWSRRDVDVTGIAERFPEDPEPEYVDINGGNIAAVTLQENNHIVLLDIETGEVVHHFSAGTVDLYPVDRTSEKPALIAMDASWHGLRREPDGVSWVGPDRFATADEGDLEGGGGRGFTLFGRDGHVHHQAGPAVEHILVRHGHYPDGRSAKRGNEPENVEFGAYSSGDFLFVGSERGNMVLVYDAATPSAPVFRQALPTGVGPEGIKAIPSRGLLVVASELDRRDKGLRSALNIYRLSQDPPMYPTLLSEGRDGALIPFGAQSGLAASLEDAAILYSIEDSFYQKNRIFKIDASGHPARIVEAVQIRDAQGVLAAFPVAALGDPGVKAGHPSRRDVFDAADLAAMRNGDGTVNLDPEGIAAVEDGFWIVSEGAGTVGDEEEPVHSWNLLIKTDLEGVIQQVVGLPDELNGQQMRYGLEGVAASGGKVYVAFQRAWGNEAHPRLGIYDPADESWDFVFYPLDKPASPRGGWVGLSDLSPWGEGQFLVVERDNQSGPDAAIKRLYRIDLRNVPSGGTVCKTLVRDLILEGDLTAPGGLVYEKIEGCAVTLDGEVYLSNDNDGVHDSPGENQLFRLGKIR